MSAEREAALRLEANRAMAAHATARDGDSAAFRRLFAIVEERLFAYILRRICDAARAEDLMQQTLLHMHRARGTYDARRGVIPWMYAIAHNLVVDDVRRSGHEVVMDTDGGGPEPECPLGAADEQLIGAQLEARIHEVLCRLPENQRAAYELVDLEGLSYQEAAESLGVSVSSITSLLHRARAALHAVFAEDQD